VLSEKVSKLYITFAVDLSPVSTPYSIGGVLRDHRQSKSEAVSKVLPLVHGVPMIITSSMFIGFERMRNEWKVVKVSYEFGIESFLRLCLDWTQKGKILRLLKSTQHRNSSHPADFKIA
jgi:hypothetical protein